MTTMNPFIGRGVPVSGERLVGRRQLLEKLVECLRAEAHCSIVGLPRLGKTSVAREALRLYEAGQSGITAGYVTLDAVRGPTQAYARILDETAGNQSETDYRTSTLSHDDIYDVFLRSLRKRRKASQRGVVVVDEIDAIVRPDFDDASLFVSRLREVANDRDRYGLTFIFVSRRSLDMIQGAVDCSTLAGLCEVKYMQPLDRDGLGLLVGRSPVPVDQGAVDSLWNLTGGHPFLAEVVMSEAVEREADRLDASNIEDAQHAQSHEFTNQYHQLQSLLSQESMFDALCELVVGPRWRSLNPHVVYLLKHYGLIRSTIEADGGVECMSQHLREFLTHLTRTTPTWFLLGEVEQQLRYLVLDRMHEAYGENWFHEISQRHPKLNEALEKLASQRQREKKLFGDAASDYVLDYAYIGDLKDLIFVEWDRYRSLLGGAKSDWERRFQDVMKVRNPMAHHRPVPADILQDAEKSCKTFLDCLRRSGTSD